MAALFAVSDRTYLPFRFDALDGPGGGTGSGEWVTGADGGLKDEHEGSLVLQPEVCGE